MLGMTLQHSQRLAKTFFDLNHTLDSHLVSNSAQQFLGIELNSEGLDFAQYHICHLCFINNIFPTRQGSLKENGDLQWVLTFF